ncbi:hypothetical protein NEIRO03_1664 [Nematocida sp. AWRm78]|nr:hypothetical protein NEIRO02_1724 [Nematocida sp. AWRm79]KAI5184210.1 hypothetical protein NEIRO03_1664 [Nematocida sp. AWRm78]
MRYLTRNIITSNITEEIATAASQTSNSYVDIKHVLAIIMFSIALGVLFIIFIAACTCCCFFGFDEFKTCMLCIIYSGRNIFDDESNEERSNSVYTRTPAHIITVPPSSSLDQPATTPLSKDTDLPSYDEAVANNEQPPPKYSDLF